MLPPVIAKIINNSLQLGVFYEHWKVATVIPLLKKLGLALVTTNYRPVSNLAFLTKIVEKCGIRQFKHHMEKNNLHSKFL